MAKRSVRLDDEMVSRGLASDRGTALKLILAGHVRIEGFEKIYAGMKIDPALAISVQALKQFVSRGGQKLDHALDVFSIDVAGSICADIGSSTGGFTDCLLQRGASRVYAIDTAKGELAWKLREDARVVVMEGTNACYVESLPDRLDMITVDISLLPLHALFRTFRALSCVETTILVLIKPQYEAQEGELPAGGVVVNEQVRGNILARTLALFQQEGFQNQGLTESPIAGGNGNIEFLALFSQPAIEESSK